MQKQIWFYIYRIILKFVGLYAKCAEKSCKKYFHCLCAYLEGYEFHIQDSKDNKDDKTRNGLDPKIYCPDHQLDKEVR